jgi:FAD/FMN-containing dehydrogenase
MNSSTVDPSAIAALERELKALLGDRGVSTDLKMRQKSSVDEAGMSPILSEQLPLGLADIVAFPTSADQVAQVVAAATKLGIPITPRGKGTGNYAQAIPMQGGLVIDLSKARAVIEVGDGFITAEAGATMVQLEQQAWAKDQQLWMYPSTAQSSIGGFLSGGSGGTGTIAHGSNWQGFVTALDVVYPDTAPAIIHLEGDEAQPYVHTYGVAGIIVRATVRLEPLQDWRGFYASFGDFESALAMVRALRALDPAPRLVSADLAAIADTLPDDAAIPKGRASLRAILDASTVVKAQELVGSVGGRVEDVREGAQASLKISMLSYNHPIYWLQKSAEEGHYFHVEVGREALIDRIDEVHAVYPGGMLHIEAGHDFPIGMLAAPYVNAETVLAGYPALEALGVRVHSPHQWYVDHREDEIRALKAAVDPEGLLNPGKLKETTGVAA